MREIKFRGKNVHSYDWVYGDLIHGITKCFVGEKEVHEGTVGQYIGLKDKDGKEVYEGDIIDIHQTVNGCSLFEVVWDKIGWGAKYVRTGSMYEYDLEELFDLNYTEKYPWEVEFEIIDNIHENPELLEVK